jgi:NitT/TauT family transport system substrate-binding protein
MRSFRSAIGAIILGFSASVAVAIPARAADKVTLMLNWYIYGEHAPFYYGLVKGYYAAEGIDLEIQEGRGSGFTTQAVAAKSVTFGYVDVPTMLRAAVKGAPVIAVGVLLQKSPMSVMAFTDKNIRKPADIKGKTVAITPGGSNEQIWPLFLKQTGLSESDFHTVAGDPQTKVNAVINGRADMVIGYPMDQGMKILDATGKRVYPIKFADYGIHLVSSGIIAHADMPNSNPDLLRRFMAASAKSVAGAVRDPQGATEAILKVSPKAGKPDTLLEGFKETTEFYLDGGRASNPFRVADDVMTETVTTMVDYGGLDPSAKNNPKAYYTNSAVSD